VYLLILAPQRGDFCGGEPFGGLPVLKRYEPGASGDLLAGARAFGDLGAGNRAVLLNAQRDVRAGGFVDNATGVEVALRVSQPVQ